MFGCSTAMPAVMMLRVQSIDASPGLFLKFPQPHKGFAMVVHFVQRGFVQRNRTHRGFA
jgi:hypothetical protein